MACRSTIPLLRGFVLILVAMGMATGAARAGCTAGTALADGAWRTVRPGDTPAEVLRQADRGKLHRFDPQRMQTFPVQGLGSWVVLQPCAPGLAGPRVLSIPSPPLGAITLYDASGPVMTNALSQRHPTLPAHGRIAFALPAVWSPLAPVLLKFEPASTLAAPVTFHLRTRAGFRRADTRWLVMASASFGIMLAMGLMALCFAIMLRDATFAWYAAYVGGYAGIQAVQTGFVLHPLQLSWLGPLLLPVGAALTALSVTAAVLFMTAFCNLRRYAPRLRVVLLAMAGLIALLALAGLTQLAFIRSMVHALVNPLLALCAVLMLGAATAALVRGSRQALFFLVGWLPLLALTALSSAQVDGALPGIDWFNPASLAAGAVEALVLAVGLADRTLNMRREHLRARELAHKDPLTGIFNRRGWIDAAQRRMDEGGTHSLLFMDLDHFKTLNDELGHTAGDQALVAVAQAVAAELRPQDLLGRFGGEEFVAMLSHTASAPALLVAQRLCRRLHRLEIPRNLEGAFLSLSIGQATRHQGDTLSSLLERADEAMYVAKSRGRNRVVDEQAVDGPRPSAMRNARPVGAGERSGAAPAAPSREGGSAA